MSDSNNRAPIFLTSREAVKKCDDVNDNGTKVDCHNVNIDRNTEDQSKLPEIKLQHDSKPTNEYTGVKQGANIATNSIDGHELPTLAFPVTINIDEINPTGGGCDILSSENYDTFPSSTDSFCRNKNRSSVRVKRSSNSKLTLEEEERVAEILRQEDDDMQNYILPTSEEEMTRETELDDLLAGLGYQFSFDEGRRDSSEGVNTRGDPVLRELAEKRSQEEKAKAIDHAIRALLREPLPRVIKYLQDNATDDGISLLSSIGESTLTAPLNEDVIKDLVQRVKLTLERDNMDLACSDSVRLLATSILNSEAAKMSTCSGSQGMKKTLASQRH